MKQLQIREFKYLLAYLIPTLALLNFFMRGYATFLLATFVFVFIPLLELTTKGSKENFSEEKETAIKDSAFFDVLLWLHVPILYGLLLTFFYVISHRQLTVFETIGMVSAMGIICGGIGINVAHELGHRNNTFEQTLAKALLLSSLYMHFIIEHNRGHHKYVSTPLDPASARYNETIYVFWWRSVTGNWLWAWKLEQQRLTKAGVPVFSIHNEMLVFQAIQLLFICLIGFIWGGKVLICFLGAAIIGFLLLELVNYIEHYGLLRKEIKQGIYERVLPCHSWNSNHSIGRILLYELTRHSDHHYLASRKYQILRHFDEAPQLPTGYPCMMVVALFPPLWFKIMNPRVKEWQTQRQLVKTY